MFGNIHTPAIPKDLFTFINYLLEIFLDSFKALLNTGQHINLNEGCIMKSAIDLFQTEVTGVTTKGVCLW
jgi:hypothetical protein